MNNPGKESNDWYSLQEKALKLSDQAFKNLVGEYEDQIRNLRYEINSRDKKISDLKNKLDLTNKQLNSLKNEKSELCNILDSLEEQSRNRNSKVDEFYSEISEIKGEQELLIAKLERCISKFNDIAYCTEKNQNQKELQFDDNSSLLCEQCENIEIKEIPNLLISEAIQHPSNFVSICNSNRPCESKEDFSESQGIRPKILFGSVQEDSIPYLVSKSGVWNRISQVLPKESYFSLLNFVRQYHLGLITEEELKTEIQNALLSNNDAVRTAFTKDILSLSSK
ncbi:hypothetical protein HWI79_1298 [Cryptosporidium felis]|nr:hypothetical protein HWI79_1298 [Cryptosporidium felis]